ncbi:hypothetical protein ABVF61_16190 [Roseibium sp. HPY-6]|uniref:hypothetical protein n=1 Tax=Roseibium sp. HPY-6 TaxID=3229852 RepID=UPI0033900C29
MSGSPVRGEKTCPLGGEKFEIVETMMCTIMGRTMSFRQVTTCEFVTKLPVCPSNGLPLYREFSERELEQLGKFVETEDYKVIRKLPPWQRAYKLAEVLEHTRSKGAFLILLQAFWFENEALLKNGDLFEEFIEEAEAEFGRVDKEKPFVAAITGYALALADETELADEWLARAVSLADAMDEQNENADYLRAYLSRVSECQDNMASQACHPDAVFRP